MKNHPHDEFFKYLFSLLDVAKEFLQNFLPPEVLEVLDIDTLVEDKTEYSTPELTSVISDKVFQCELKEGVFETNKRLKTAIAVLLEHKSYTPPYPHFQLNEYRQRIWSNMANNRKKPVPILPIVLYHGQSYWKEKAMVDYFGNLPEPLKPFVGGFDFILVDLSKYTDKQLMKLSLGFLAYGMLTMKHAKDKQWLQSQLRIIFEKGDDFLKTTDGQNFVEHLFVYYARIAEFSGQNLRKAIINNLSKSMQTSTLSTYEQIKLEGKIEGKIEGKKSQAEQSAKILIRKYPMWTNDQIIEVTGLEASVIENLRKKISKKKKPSKNGSGKSDQ